MADTSKSQKLASARKKFKELKKKKNASLKTNFDENIAQLSRDHTPFDSLTSSNHSSVNEPEVVLESTMIAEPTAAEHPHTGSCREADVLYNTETTPLPDYFDNDECLQDPSTFFDNITVVVSPEDANREHNQSDQGLFNYPITCDNSAVNTFNSYSFQYDTPFNSETNTHVPKDKMHELDVNKEVELNENPCNHSSTADTYFTEDNETQQAENQELISSGNQNQPNIELRHNIISDMMSDKHADDLIEFLDNKEKEIAMQYGSFDSGNQIHSAEVTKNIQNEENFTPSEIKHACENVSSIENGNSASGLHEGYQQAAASQEVPSQSGSSIESLLQLSNQMAQLIEPTNEYGLQNEMSELEKRNLELAAYLEKERIKTQQLTAGLAESTCRITELETELNNRVTENNIAEINEISRLREELRSHVQTIGMLVAEKTELSANASQFQLTAKQKISECEELQNRLKASRSRVIDLEKENSLLKGQLSRYNVSENQRTEHINKLMEETTKLKDEKEETVQDLLEAKEKLKTISEHNLSLQKQVQDLSTQLSLANIKLQQLTSAGNQQVDGQVEHLVQEKFALEKQVSDLTQMLKTVTKERDDSSLQYQLYTQQLNGQLTNLAKKLEQRQLENEALLIQEQHRVKHIGELERQLQNLQNDHINFSGQKNNGDYKKEYQLAVDNFQTMTTKHDTLQAEYTKIANEKDMLLRDLESKIQTITHLEDLLEQVKENQPDNSKVLAAMESDKVAAARAVSQNIELKKQMEGMQEVLIKLNDDKVDLTEKLTKESKINEDIMDDLQKTKQHLGTLADAIEIKDKELSNLRHSSEELSRQVLQQGQLTDRLRHYEAQNHGIYALQEELQQARNTIAELTIELNSLKTHHNEYASGSVERAKLENNDHQEVSSNDNRQETVVHPQEVSSASQEIFPLVSSDDVQKTTSNHIQELQIKLSELELKNKHLEEVLQKGKHMDKIDGATKTTDGSNNDNTLVNSLDKETAMKHLEEKFLHAMDEIAKLTDEKQGLEHLVLQLQGETETIGEYVALYQYQRSILKQKALEKDQQLKQLANDRLHMKNKLDQLNALVKKLVIEKGAFPSELLVHQENLNNESHKLCEEHSKIHEEINRITADSLNSNTDLLPGVGTETAEQIIALLSEIKSSSLVQPTENVHHCPWCSGKLITV